MATWNVHPVFRRIKKIFEVKPGPVHEPPRRTRGHWMDQDLHVEPYVKPPERDYFYDQDQIIYKGEYMYEDGF